MESTCFCGFALVGTGMDELVSAGLAHFGATHPEVGLTPVLARNYLEGEQRADGPIERLPEIGPIEIRPISSLVRDDILEFFDRRAFPDNVGWSACYCMYHHIGGGEDGPWPERLWDENRTDLSRRVDSGETTGVVAYVGGVLAGFCNASARSQYPDKSDGSDRGVASIVCFVVAPPYRRHGVQRRLLSGAVSHLRTLGFERAEGYPRREMDDIASAFVGTLPLFEKEGFEVSSEDPLVVSLAL